MVLHKHPPTSWEPIQTIAAQEDKRGGIKARVRRRPALEERILVTWANHGSLFKKLVVATQLSVVGVSIHEGDGVKLAELVLAFCPSRLLFRSVESR